MNLDELPVKDNLPGEQVEYLQKQKQEYKLIGKLRRIPGHTLFSFNTKTGEIKPAQFTNEVAVGMDSKPIKKAKCVIEPNCIYRQALNRKNFIRKLKKMGLVK